jgi:ketosteroid isomerase-like protein
MMVEKQPKGESNMCRKNRLYVVMLLTVLLLSACQPIQPAPAAQQAEGDAMSVMDQFFAAYSAYDMDKMLSLQTDDVVWTWIDPGKNFWPPEGVRAGASKDEIRVMFDEDRGQGRRHRLHPVGRRKGRNSENDGTVGERVHKGHRCADDHALHL